MAAAAEGGASSPVSVRHRCCLDADSLVEQRERKLSASDSSSKDQSDTSLDSEDSCVSVIFVPHPEQVMTKQRSNSSESSDSLHSGRGSPMSPNNR